MNLAFAREISSMIKTGWKVDYLEARSTDCAAAMSNADWTVWINPQGVETYRFSHALKKEVPVRVKRF